MKNGHVCLRADKHYYSVPYRYIGEKVKLLYTDSRVEIYYCYQRIALHQRKMHKYQYSTIIEHLASAHRYASEWTPEKFIKQASAIHLKPVSKDRARARRAIAISLPDRLSKKSKSGMSRAYCDSR